MGPYLRLRVPFAALCCIVGSALAQTPALFQNINSVVREAKRYESFEGGLRSRQRLIATTHHGVTFESALLRSQGRDYGDATLSNTKERSILSRLSWNDAWKNLWFVGTDLSQSGQKIEKFSATETADTNNQSSFSLVYGWNRKLFGNLDLTLYSGASSCFASEHGQATLLPIGGIILSREFEKGLVSFELANKIDGTGMASGVYGSQKRREAKLSARYDLNERISVSGYCLISHVDANFEEAGSAVKETPLVTANVDLSYRLSHRFSTKVSFAHRAYLGALGEQEVQRGPMGGLSIHYLAF